MRSSGSLDQSHARGVGVSTMRRAASRPRGSIADAEPTSPAAWLHSRSYPTDRARPQRPFMFVHPQFDPIAFHVGPLAVRWYGLMYLLAFTLVLVLGRWRISHKLTKLTARDLDDLLFFCMLGTIVGGRLGYVLFYKLSHYLEYPLDLFKVWEGGMSFHGGLIGVILAMLIFAKKRGYTFWQISDFGAPLVPTGLAAGRMGNFINGELWGRPTDVPWAMIFPQAPDHQPRHPSQLYEVGTEGILLFILVWWFARKPRPDGAISGVFLIGYGLARFAVEFTREPDDFLGLLALNLSMGQWLSIPMILFGISIVVWAYRRNQVDTLPAV
jgi:phosphatidylglycerol:prolipoprotein diacylglycerol transferase